LVALRGRDHGVRADLRTGSGDLISVGVADEFLTLEGPAVCVFTTDWARDGLA
jgi:hypothetical protein